MLPGTKDVDGMQEFVLNTDVTFCCWLGRLTFDVGDIFRGSESTAQKILGEDNVRALVLV